MKYKLTKMQIKMLIEGKPVQRNRTKIYPTTSVKEALEIINNNNLYDQYDVLIDEANYLNIVEK